MTKKDVIERLTKYFNEATLDDFASDEALGAEELQDLLYRAADSTLCDPDATNAAKEAALEDQVWAEQQLTDEEEDEMTEEFAPAPPVKEHAGREAQLEIAREINSPKEASAAIGIDDQDRGGIPDPAGYIHTMKTEVLEGVIVQVRGQTFRAPDGWKIKETRPSGKTLYYGSILQRRKVLNEAVGSQFFLVRDA